MHSPGNPFDGGVAIGNQVRVRVVAIRGQRACLAIAAPPGLAIRGINRSSNVMEPLAAHATGPPGDPKTRWASQGAS